MVDVSVRRLSTLTTAELDKMAALPDTTGLKNRVVIQKNHTNQYDRARQYLQRAMLRLHGENELALAREELARIDSVAPRPA